MKINDKHLVAFVNSNAPIDREGYLQKKGELNKSFQKRWFVMKGNLLFYFEKRGDREPIGVIVLESCTVELGDCAEVFAFDLVFQGGGSRTYTLAAETQEEMESWMKTITCAGYEYTKLMVNELQRQLDELNNLDRSRKSQADAIPRHTRSELTRTVLRTSEPDRDMLVDVSLPGANTPQAKQEKRIGRINPFNVDVYAPTDVVIPNAFSKIERASEALEMNCRDFNEMHRDFGELIRKKCHLPATEGENSLF